MATLAIKMILTGGRAGRTELLHKWRFVNGVHILHGDEKTVMGAVKYLGRVFKAFPEGSEELRAHGGGALPNSQRPVDSGVPPVQSGAPEVPADNGSGAAGAAPGASGGVSEGSGYKDARLGKIAQAVAALDRANDDHWTADGLPRVDAVSTLAGDATVSRKDVDKAAPGVIRT